MDDSSHVRWYRSIIDVLSHWREIAPDKSAYTFVSDKGREESRVTFLDLHRRVTSFASHLRAGNLGGERVVILLPSGIDYIVAFLACLAGGAIAVPLYPPSGKRDWNRLGAVVEDCQPRAVILSGAVARRYRSELSAAFPARDCRHLLMDEPGHEARAAGQDAAVEIDPKGVAFLQYTSGSTGRPKGVMVSHENIMHNAHQMAAGMGSDMRTVIVGWLPFYHDMGLIGKVLHAAAIGAHAVLMSPYTFLRNPANWLRAISHYQGTMAGAPNFAFDLCVDKIDEAEIDRLDLSSLTCAYNGAEPIKAATLERFYQRFRRAGLRREALFPCYGLAEGTLYVSGGPLHDVPITMDVDRAALTAGRVVPAAPGAAADRIQTCVSVGEPFHEQTARIVDPVSWVVLPDRQIGEIWLKSRSVARGYWRNPKETAATFQAYTTDSNEGPFLRTGDLGFLCDGRLYVTGRIKELIIINGINHYPQDIEETVQSLSDNCRVHAGAAFAFDDERLAIVQGINRTKASPDEFDELIARIRQGVLQVHGIAPSYVGLVNPGEIPKTSSGKIQRGLIRRRLLAEEIPLLRSWRADAADSGEREQALQSQLAEAARQDGGAVEPRATADTPLSALARQKIEWIRDYFAQRVNSFVIDERRTMPPYIVLDFGNQGLLGMQVPRQYGGPELSTRDFLAIMKVLGGKDLTLALFVGLNNVLGVRPILQFGTPALKEQYLPLLAAGRELAAFALTEPGAGSNPQAIEASARRTENGYRVSGTKFWSGSAAWCGVLNVFAKTIDGNGRAAGISAFAIPQGSAGLRQGPEALTMGMRGMIQNTVFLEDVEARAAQILGKPGHGMAVAQDAMCYGRLTIAAVCLGGMKLCYQIMLRYATERYIATGRLVDNPHTRAVLTETMHAITGIEALIDRVAAGIDAGRAAPSEILGVCKSLSTEWLWRTVDRTMQLAGGRGYIESNFIPQVFRDARVFRIFEGPTETMNHFVGSSALKSRQVIREYLTTQMDEAAVAEHYDAVLDRVGADYGAGGGPALQHWLYLAAGDYVNQLVLYAAGGTANAAPGLRRWALEHVRSSRRELDAAIARFTDLAPTDDLREFGGVIDRQIGAYGQHYPLPNALPDPLLAADRRAAAAPPPIAADGARAVALALASAAVPVGGAINGKDGHAPSPPARNGQDVQAFLGRWIAKRCGRPIEAIGAEVEFAMLGLGSVDSFELSAELAEHYALDLDPTVFWNYPNIRELARFVRDELDVRDRR